MERHVQITCEGKSSTAHCEEILWTKPMAMRKAIKAMFWVWLGTLVTVFIPLIHFVSVPAGLIAGPILAVVLFKMYNGAVEISCAEAPCPACNAKMPLKFDAKVKECERSCRQCQKDWKVTV